MSTNSSNPSAQTRPSDKATATIAFLLGWSVSETMGRYRRGIQPHSSRPSTAADYAPRLLVSTGYAEKSTDAFELSAQRIVQLYRVLGFEADDQVSPSTRAIFDLPGKIHAWLYNSAEFYSQRELREILNDWTLQVWARLGGTSAESARALTAGLSLADTYWYLRLPSRRPKEPLSAEDWRRMLSKYRLEAERARLQSLSSCLPSYVVPVIRRELALWSIGTELGYRQGRLVRLRREGRHGPLAKKDESELQHALERQVRNWQVLIFGLRPAAGFLLSRDRRLIALLRWSGLFLGLFVTALLLLGAILLAAYLISLGPLPGLLRYFGERPAQVSEYVAVVSLLWTILIATPVPLALRAAYQGTRGLQQTLDDSLKIWFITRRTYVPWDMYLRQKQDQAPDRLDGADKS